MLIVSEYTHTNGHIHLPPCQDLDHQTANWGDGLSLHAAVQHAVAENIPLCRSCWPTGALNYERELTARP